MSAYFKQETSTTPWAVVIMQLRFRHPNGIGTLDVNPNDTFATLKATIGQRIALPPGKAIQGG